MILVVGLGNPGKKFQLTRHNVGFRAVDEIAANFQFSIFNFQSIFNAQISKGKINGQNVILVKPQTFMNLSGKAVKSLIRNWKLETELPLAEAKVKMRTKLSLPIKNLIIIHDDLDLPLGKMKISVGRGAAGHKGVESIIKEMKTKNFVRFRIGIRPNSKVKIQKSKLQFKNQNVEDFVLKNFTKKEQEIVKEVIKKTAEAIEFSLKEGVEKAMNLYNC